MRRGVTDHGRGVHTQGGVYPGCERCTYPGGVYPGGIYASLGGVYPGVILMRGCSVACARTGCTQGGWVGGLPT